MAARRNRRDTEHTIVTTMPDEIPRHNISDEELDMLCDPSRDELWETKWAALGAGLGALPTAVDALLDFSRPTGVLTVLDLVQVLIAVVAIAVWVVLRFVVQRKTAKSFIKRDEIRRRTRRIREGAANDEAA